MKGNSVSPLNLGMCLMITIHIILSRIFSHACGVAPGAAVSAGRLVDPSLWSRLK